MTRLLKFIFPILSTGFLAWGSFANGLPWVGMGVICFGILWIVGLALAWKWIPSTGLVIGYGVAAWALLQIPTSGPGSNLPSGASTGSGQTNPGITETVFLLGALFALVSWDLSEFQFRLVLASKDDNIHALEQKHLLRLFSIFVGGGILSIVVLNLHIKSSFEWTMLLIIFAIWGISRMVAWLQKEN
jgi:hypothetical protein